MAGDEMVDNITDVHLNKLWEMAEARGAWQATTHRVTKSCHNLVPEKQQQSRPLNTYTLLVQQIYLKEFICRK